MGYYIKKSNKPLEARELTERNQQELLEWLSGMGKEGPDGCIRLKTPESHDETQLAVTGDFIIKGYTKELGWHFWPVKPSYFHENYEEVPNYKP